MRAIIVDTNVASFLFKGDTRANQYTPHLADAIPGYRLCRSLRWSVRLREIGLI